MHISFSRTSDGLAVKRANAILATIRKTKPGEPGFCRYEPWMLARVSGRIDRFHSCAAARDEALKI